MMPIYRNTPRSEPDIQSIGRAWLLSLGENACPTNIANWLVDTRGYGNPNWWWYMVMLIHLRTVPGEPPAELMYPEATHEMVFAALVPTEPLPDIEFREEGFATLHPVELVHQFTVRSDEQAERVVKLLVHHICEGHSPDQDNIAYWLSAIDQTAEHVTYGTHPSRN